MRRKIITALLALVITLSATQIYAATVLDTNIFNLIKEIITPDTDTSSIDELKDKYEYDLDKFLDVELDNAKAELEEYNKNSLIKSENDLEKYYSQLKENIIFTIEKSKDTAKLDFDKNISEKTDNAKTEIFNHLEELLEERQPNNN